MIARGPRSPGRSRRRWRESRIAVAPAGPGRVVARAVIEPIAIRLRPRGPCVTNGEPPWVQPVGSGALASRRVRGPAGRRAAALPPGTAATVATSQRDEDDPCPHGCASFPLRGPRCKGERGRRCRPPCSSSHCLTSQPEIEMDRSSRRFWARPSSSWTRPWSTSRFPALSDDLGAGSPTSSGWSRHTCSPSFAAAGRRLLRRPVRAPPDLHPGVGPLRGTSILCAIAPRRGVLIGARALQGFAGALLVPGITGRPGGHLRGRGTRPGGRHLDGVDGNRHRDRPGGRRGAGRGDSPGAPSSWVNVPLILFTMWLAHRSVRESVNPDADRHIDWLGILLSAVGLGAAGLRADPAADARLGQPAWFTAG